MRSERRLDYEIGTMSPKRPGGILLITSNHSPLFSHPPPYGSPSSFHESFRDPLSYVGLRMFTLEVLESVCWAPQQRKCHKTTRSYDHRTSSSCFPRTYVVTGDSHYGASAWRPRGHTNHSTVHGHNLSRGKTIKACANRRLAS